MDFDFHTEFKQSTQRVEKFVEDFCQSISTAIVYNKNSVRLFSISKSEKEKKKSEVKFGITSGDITLTEQLAQLLKVSLLGKITDATTYSIFIFCRIVLQKVSLVIKFLAEFFLEIMITYGHQHYKR